MDFMLAEQSIQKREDNLVSVFIKVGRAITNLCYNIMRKSITAALSILYMP